MSTKNDLLKKAAQRKIQAFTELQIAKSRYASQEITLQELQLIEYAYNHACVRLEALVSASDDELEMLK